MIDIESQVYTAVSKAVKAEYPDSMTTGIPTQTPSKFPCVSVTEIDNATFRKTRDSSMTENHASVSYEVRVYSNARTGKKTQCRTIAGIADSVMEKLGFTRRMLAPVPNLNDPSIYQMVGRYTAIVSKNEVIYRR